MKKETGSGLSQIVSYNPAAMSIPVVMVMVPSGFLTTRACFVMVERLALIWDSTSTSHRSTPPAAAEVVISLSKGIRSPSMLIRAWIWRSCVNSNDLVQDRRKEQHDKHAREANSRYMCKSGANKASCSEGGTNKEHESDERENSDKLQRQTTKAWWYPSYRTGTRYNK